MKAPRLVLFTTVNIRRTDYKCVSKTILRCAAINIKPVNTFRSSTENRTWYNFPVGRRIDKAVLGKQVASNKIKFILIRSSNNSRWIKENTHVATVIAVADAPHFLGGCSC